MDLKKKVILVTGSSSGIGKEVALLCAEKGAYVIVTYCHNKKGGQEVFNECSKKTKSMLIKLDIQNNKSMFKSLKKIKKRFGRIDILMNNGAVIYRKPFAKQTLEEIEQQLNTNLLGDLKITKIALPLLNKKKSMIINMGSQKSKHPFRYVVPYCASKYGVRGFTEALALELPKSVKICLFNPNPTATRMHYFKGDNPKKVADLIVKVMEEKIKAKRGGDVDAKSYF